MNQNGIDTLQCVIIVGYLLCVVVSMFGFMRAYPIYYELYYIHAALSYNYFIIKRYCDIEGIQYYFNEIIKREWTENDRMEIFGHDVGF